MRNITLLVSFLLTIFAASTLALALPPNGTHTAILTQPNVSVRFKDRIESTDGCTVFYELLFADPVATGKDSLPLFIQLSTPERAIPKDFRYFATLRNLSKPNVNFINRPSSSGAPALLRVNTWVYPTDKYLLSVRCPPSWRAGLWRDWKPQLWIWFYASHGQQYDYTFPLK